MAEVRKSALLLRTLGFAGVVTAVILSRTLFDTEPEPNTPPSPPTIKLPQPPEEVAKPHLSKAELERIDSVAPHGVAVGTRYHPDMMRLLNG